MLILLTGFAEAAFTVYLKSGSSLSGIHSFEEEGDQVVLHLSGGQMKLPKADILKIVETEYSDVTVSESLSNTESTEESATETDAPLPTEPSLSSADEEKNARIKELMTQFDTYQSDIRQVEAEEAQLIAQYNAIQEKRGTLWNNYQIRQLERELMPLREKLQDVQRRKAELLDKRNVMADQIRALQQE
jgi:predicted RNase H-like nuclease (RuvC/YqgF family)